MQAIHLTSFVDDVSTLSPSTVPKPEPSADELRIRVTHCSPQYADILHAQGKHQNNHPRHGHVHCPFTLGYSFAGTVESDANIATDTRHALKRGDRVFGAQIGAFAEYVCVRPEHLKRIPDGISSEDACALSGQVVSYAAVTQVAKVKRGEIVLVSGASGGLGSGCCLVAKARGAKVIALTGNEDKARLMRRDMDIDLVVVTEQGDWIQQVMHFTDDKGVNAVLDSTGIVNDAIRCLAFEGRIVILGFAARSGVMEEVKVNRLLLKSASLIGYRHGESGRRFPSRSNEVFEGFMHMVKSGQLTPLIFGQYHGLQAVGQALKDLADRKVYGKIVVTVTADNVEPKL